MGPVSLPTMVGVVGEQQMPAPTSLALSAAGPVFLGDHCPQAGKAGKHSHWSGLLSLRQLFWVECAFGGHVFQSLWVLTQ